MILDTLLISATDDKHTISKLSKVCARWGFRCRPSLFRRLKLSAADDVHTLLQIIRSTPIISTYVTHVVAVVYASHTPWAHLVPLLLPSALPKLRHLSQIFIPDAPPSHGSSISFLWQAFYARFKNLTSLDFEGCHFRDFRSFAHILGRIEKLERLKCDYVTWGGDSRAQKLPERKTAFRSLRKACLYGGSDHGQFYRLFALRALDQNHIRQHWCDGLLCALRKVFSQLGCDQFYTQYDLYEGEPTISISLVLLRKIISR